MTSDVEKVQSPRLWQDDGWTARVVKNEDDDGWAVEMVKDGQPEPALVAAWTMGRDKKNPKSLDPASFYTWVKTANEIVRRHEQQLHAQLHKSVKIMEDDAELKITLEIIPDEVNPYALLTAWDATGNPLARVRVEPSFRLNDQSAEDWVKNEFRRPSDRRN